MKFLAVWTFLLLSCSMIAPAQQDPASATAEKAEVPESVRARLLHTLPNPLPAQGAPQGPPAFYTAGTLYEYMDGAADVFLLYDFQALLHQEIKTGQVDVTVDVFDVGNPQDAFGIYAAERSPKYDFITIGAEGYRNDGIVNFLQDRYYIKLAAFGDGADAVLDQFARSISERIGGTRTLPALIAQLPAANRKPHTEQYMRKDPLGHPFLSPAFQADYAWEKGDGKLVISVGRDDADAQARLKSLTEHFQKSGKCQPAPELGEGAVRASNSYEGALVARAKGRYLVLLLNPGVAAAGFFTDAIKQLQ